MHLILTCLYKSNRSSGAGIADRTLQNNNLALINMGKMSEMFRCFIGISEFSGLREIKLISPIQHIKVGKNPDEIHDAKLAEKA